MLTDAALKALKPKGKIYKVTDRDDMYVVVALSGHITFRFDYRLNGRRETLTIGRYGADGLSLAAARQMCIAARSAIMQGVSPAQEKQRAKRQLLADGNFGAVSKRWFDEAAMAESTRSMRKSIYDRDILPAWKSRLLTEITPDDLRALCKKVKDRGAPATAIHVRDIVKQIYGFAKANGAKVANPGINRNFRAERAGTDVIRNSDCLQSCRRGPDAANHPARAQTDPADDGSEERTYRRRLG
jgi:hypothetical protein